MKSQPPRRNSDNQHAFDWFTDMPQPEPVSSPGAADPTLLEPVQPQASESPERPPSCPDSSAGSYPPGHPWHYYHEGDNATPVPVDEIPASLDAGRWLERDLPKNPAKREAALRAMLDRARREQEADRLRYQDIVARGADALSNYDRQIAHGGNDALARASSLALKFNHIAIGLGRVAWIEIELEQYTHWLL